jgi:predicted ABC-type ATPase
MTPEEPLVRGLLRRVITIRHFGPGAHPGTGTDQTVHGGGNVPGDGSTEGERRVSGLRGSGTSLAAHDRWLAEVELPPRRETIQKALDEFGTTEDPKAAGFLLPDGSYLNFARSNRERYINHDEIAGPTGLSVQQFMLVTGAIRVAAYGDFQHDDAGLALEFIRGAPLPTSQQWDRISSIPTQSADVEVSSSSGGHIKGVNISHSEGVDASRQRRFVEMLMRGEEPMAVAASVIRMVLRGGPGSGFEGHAGRPGKVGGSLPSGEVAGEAKPAPVYPRAYLEALPDALKKTCGGPVELESIVGWLRSYWLTPAGDLLVSHGEHNESAIEADVSLLDDKETTRRLGISEEERRALRHESSFAAVMASGVHRLNIDGRTGASYVAYQANGHVTRAQRETCEGIALVLGLPLSDWRIDTANPTHSERQAAELIGLVERGGPGSGHFGHEGRPGEVGGSTPGDQVVMPSTDIAQLVAPEDIIPGKVTISPEDALLGQPIQRIENTVYGTGYTTEDYLQLAQHVLDEHPEAFREFVAQVEQALDDGTSTMDAYYNPETGEWTPERQVLHDQIVNDILEPGRPAPAGTEPEAVITGGLPGSGKSSVLAERAASGQFDGYVHIDADVIKGMLPEYEGWNAGLLHDESSAIVEEVFQRCVERHMPVMYDATLRTTRNAAAVVNALEEVGYNTRLIYVDIPIEDSMRRVLNRFASGTGRYVSPFYVATRDGRNLMSLETLKGEVDAWEHWDNGQPMGQSPRLIAQGNRRQT